MQTTTPFRKMGDPSGYPQTRNKKIQAKHRLSLATLCYMYFFQFEYGKKTQLK